MSTLVEKLGFLWTLEMREEGDREAQAEAELPVTSIGFTASSSPFGSLSSFSGWGYKILIL